MWSKYHVRYTTFSNCEGVATIELALNDYGMLDMVDLVNAILSLENIKEVLEIEFIEDVRED